MGGWRRKVGFFKSFFNNHLIGAGMWGHVHLSKMNSLCATAALDVTFLKSIHNLASWT
jgi:hypothetical protein